MPSKKPQFVIRADKKETFEKMAHIAKENNRSTSQEIVHIIENIIKKYEAEHGEIIIEPPKAENSK